MNLKDSTIINLLERIALALEGKPNSLGFGEPPRPRMVYVGKYHEGKDYLWHFLDNAKNPVPIDRKALTGIIFAVSITPASRGTQYLDAFVDSGQRYVVRSELESTFASDLLAALSTLSPKELNIPLTIGVAAGVTECRASVWTGGGRRLKVPDELMCLPVRELAHQVGEALRCAADLRFVEEGA
ncbi:MAG: hypothetical protein F6K24_58215 [Okeania sp. SIO2D1]|nr:hypothetical protein [Okeania sp. SIO2D1]